MFQDLNPKDLAEKNSEFCLTEPMRLLYYSASTEDDEMFFQLDFNNGLAIYDQVVRQLKFAIAGDILKEGELVPSVRELARELTINPNTVARAYRQLQDECVLSSVRGTGLAVATGARRRCRDERVELIRTRLEQVFDEARQSRLNPDQLRELVEEELTKNIPSPAGRGLG
jgi:GntR family transcriptional regulator